MLVFSAPTVYAYFFVGGHTLSSVHVDHVLRLNMREYEREKRWRERVRNEQCRRSVVGTELVDGLRSG